MAPSSSPDCSGVVVRSAVVRTRKKSENVDVDVHSVALVIALAFRPGFESGFAIHQVPLSVLLAEAGATEKEIAASLGHTDLEQVKTYTASANNRRLSHSASNKLATNSLTLRPQN